MVYKLSRPVHLATSHRRLWQQTHRSGAEDRRVAPPQRAADVADCSTMKPILQITHELLRIAHELTQVMLSNSSDRGTLPPEICLLQLC